MIRRSALPYFISRILKQALLSPYHMMLLGENWAIKSCYSALAATSHKKDKQLRDTKEKERNAHSPVFAHDATYTSFMLKQPHHFLRGCTNTHHQENSHTHMLAQQCVAHHWIPSACSASISHHKLTSVFIRSFWHISYVPLKLSKEERFFFLKFSSVLSIPVNSFTCSFVTTSPSQHIRQSAPSAISQPRYWPSPSKHWPLPQKPFPLSPCAPMYQHCWTEFSYHLAGCT